MKKVAITQDLCRMVELMLKGGAQQKEVGERLGISKATVSRIKTAGYDAEQYRKNTTERVEKENQAEGKTVCIPLKPGQVIEVFQKPDEITACVSQAEEQVPGQICMNLQPAEEQKPEMSDQTKLMRFLAGKFGDEYELISTCMGSLTHHLVKIEDYLAQILRKMDG